jgi:hypothetical protein
VTYVVRCHSALLTLLPCSRSLTPQVLTLDPAYYIALVETESSSSLMQSPYLGCAPGSRASGLILGTIATLVRCWGQPPIDAPVGYAAHFLCILTLGGEGRRWRSL